MSWARRTSAAAAAKCSEANRRSNATTTPRSRRPPDDVAGDAVGAAADVLEREVVGDLRPPAVGPEHDRRRDVGTSAMIVTRGPPRGRPDRAGRGPRHRGGGRRRGGPTRRRSTIVPPEPAATAGPVSTMRRPPTVTDDEVVGTDLERLAGLDDPAGGAGEAVAGDRPEQRRPAAEVAPADVHRAHHDLVVGGRALHDRPVDRDRGDPLVGVRQGEVRADRRSISIGSGVYFSSAARIAPRCHMKIPAFQAAPGSFVSCTARAGTGFSSNARRT